MQPSAKKTSSRSANAERKKVTGRPAVQELLARADVRTNGDRPWDIQVHYRELYQRVLAGGSLAFGEAYMEGWWDCAALDECVHRLMAARLHEEVRSWHVAWNVVKAKLMNLQGRSRAHQVGEHHYDRGNDLFEAMLDAHMVYSCGYWRRADTLEEAQAAKLDLICRKIGVEPGDRVLDVGCGWGGVSAVRCRGIRRSGRRGYGFGGAGASRTCAVRGDARRNPTGRLPGPSGRVLRPRRLGRHVRARRPEEL